MNNKNINSIATEICINQKQFICDICPKECFTKIQYLVHSVTHLLPDYSNCHGCQEGFSHILSLNKHLEVHNNLAHIACHVCKKEFFDIDSLKEHVRGHSSESTNLLMIVKQETDIEETPLNICNNKTYSSYTDERSEKCVIENFILSDSVENLISNNNVENLISNDNVENLISNDNVENLISNDNVENLISSDNVENHISSDNIENLLISSDNVENRISSDNVKSLFRCDRCEREFFEMNHLDEHRKKLCVKKELDSDSREKLESMIYTSVDNYCISDDNNELISSYYNEISEKYTLGSGNLQNLFRCDRCNKEFLEKHRLDEHHQNICIKKEDVNSEEVEEFVSLTSVPSLLHAFENVNVTSSENLQKCNIVKIFTAKVQVQQNKKTNVCSKNFAKIKQFVCKVCQKVFSNKCSLTIHFPTHSNKKTFNCHLCKKKFTLKCLLNAHLRIHTVKKFFCGVCQKGFASKVKCLRHVYTHAIVQTFTCNICQMTFSEKSSVKTHYLSHTAEKNIACEVKHSTNDRLQNIFRCDKCKREFLEKVLLENHYQNNCIKKECNLDKCEVLESVTFTSTDNFHVSDSDGEHLSSSYNENSEKYGFASKKKLSEYVRKSARVKSLVCNICQVIFSEKSLLEKHNLDHNKEKKQEKNFTCEVCQLKFFNKRTLNKHKHIHLGPFSHVCDICSKGFARLDHLKRHYQTHSGVSQEKLSSEKALNTRKSTHSVSRSYVCDVCSKEFTRIGHLEQHCQIHTRQKTLKCETCGKSYKKKRSLTKHQSTHQLN